MKLSQLTMGKIEDYDYDPFAQAAAEDLQVVLPKYNELLIDIDTPEQLKVYEQVFNLLTTLGYDLIERSNTVSKGGVGRHITVVLNGSRVLTKLESIALQAILGSDPLREAFSFKRLDDGYPHPTLFYELKDDELPF